MKADLQTNQDVVLNLYFGQRKKKKKHLGPIKFLLCRSNPKLSETIEHNETQWKYYIIYKNLELKKLFD